MKTKIFTAFNRFQSHFTYRQRYLFIALVFVLTIPLGCFWLLKALDFSLKSLTWQSTGNQYQKALGSLLQNIIKHQILTCTQILNPELYLDSVLDPSLKHEKLSQLEKLTDEDFYYLINSLKEYSFVPPSYFGKGFSIPPQPINLPAELWEKKWDFLIEKAPELTFQSNFDLHQALIIDIQNQMKGLGNSYGLFYTPYAAVHDLVQATLIRLPEAQTLIGLLVILKEKIASGKSSSNDAVLFWANVEKLKTNAFANHNLLEKALLLCRKEFNFDPTLLTNAQESIFKYHTTIQTLLELIEISTLDTSLAQPSLPQPLPAFDSPLALQILSSNQNCRDVFISLLKEVLIAYQNSINFQKRIFQVYLLITLLLVVFYVTMRVLSRHFLQLLRHVKALSQGNFSAVFYFHTKDELGQLVASFDKMVNSVKIVASELQMLGKHLTNFVIQIGQTAEDQESQVIEQEASIEKINGITSQITLNAKSLASTMNGLSQGLKQTSLTLSSKERLEHMQEKMLQLNRASAEIVERLILVQDQVNKTRHLMAFMTDVGTQANLLSLSAAIESVNFDKSKKNFSEITQNIQRFAENTASSSMDIEKIINEVSINVSTVRSDANQCLKEITEGAHRLITVSTQLTSITKKREEQVKKFENVNEVMQEQALAAESIIQSITGLSESSQENSRSVRQLRRTITALGTTANELQNVLNSFFKNPGKEEDFEK